MKVNLICWSARIRSREVAATKVGLLKTFLNLESQRRIGLQLVYNHNNVYNAAALRALRITQRGGRVRRPCPICVIFRKKAYTIFTILEFT